MHSSGNRTRELRPRDCVRVSERSYEKTKPRFAGLGVRGAFVLTIAPIALVGAVVVIPGFVARLVPRLVPRFVPRFVARLVAGLVARLVGVHRRTVPVADRRSAVVAAIVVAAVV